MPQDGKPLYAARLNSFKVGAERYWPGKNRITTVDLLERAAAVDGLNAADLNFPDHFEGTSPPELSAAMDRLGIHLNGLAMRYYSDPAFKLGAFTSPDHATRRAAIDLTRRGLDTLAEMGGSLMTLWLGQDEATAAAGLLTAGGCDTIVTLGGGGALLALADGDRRHFPALPVEVHSRHGAGDAFAGALAARLALGADLLAALGYAQVAAALHVSSMPDERESITPAMVLKRLGAG